MKIVHVNRSLIVNSGISVFVAEIAGAQAELGHDVHLRYTWRPDYPVDRHVDVRAFRDLDELTFRPDVIHIHGLWSMDMVRAMSWCRRHQIKYVISPHGGLMPRVLRKGWLKKKVFYLIFLRRNLLDAFAIHCTGEGESAAVRSLGIGTRTFIAPLGCHLPYWPVRRTGDGKTILFLSRISEEKGLVCLLDAWKKIDHTGWRLVLAGPDWLGFRAELERKIGREQIRDVEFIGAADVEMKDRLYRQASLFVLPSPVENFSMVVLDALAYGIPTICTKGTPWRVIEDRKCGWWIDPDSTSALEKALSQAMSTATDQYEQMQVRAREVAKEFSWIEIAGKVVSGYDIV